MWFLQRKLRISWTANKSNETVLQEAFRIRSFINKIHKCLIFFLGHVLGREKLDHFVTIGMMEEKPGREKKQKIL